MTNGKSLWVITVRVELAAQTLKWMAIQARATTKCDRQAMSVYWIEQPWEWGFGQLKSCPSEFYTNNKQSTDAPPRAGAGRHRSPCIQLSGEGFQLPSSLKMFFSPGITPMCGIFSCQEQLGDRATPSLSTFFPSTVWPEDGVPETRNELQPSRIHEIQVLNDGS